MRNILILLLFICSITVISQEEEEEEEEVDYGFKNEMHSKSLRELRLIRNEFFAREGYIFKSKDLQEHFSQFDWYHGTKSIDEIELSPSAKLKSEIIREVESGKKLNPTRIKTLELLSMLPGDSMGSWDWSTEDRSDYLYECTEVGYLINNNSGMMQLRFLNDNHLFMQVVDGVWEFLTIALGEDQFFILTNDIVTGGSSFRTYIVDEYHISNLDKDIFPENLEKHFLSLGQNCQDQDLASHFFDYTFDKNTLTITSWKDECLKGKELKLKFNPDKIKYEIQY